MSNLHSMIFVFVVTTSVMSLYLPFRLQSYLMI